MHPSSQDRRDDCAGGCEQCVQRPGIEASSPWNGGRLVAASAVVFLLPLIAAFLGAARSGPDPARQLFGALAGFAAGAALAAGLVRWLRPAEHPAP